jgi:arylsulfatase A-like enzyme
MKFLKRLCMFAVMTALSFQFAATGKAVEQSGKPNVLMICIDDLNDWVGFLGGHPQAITPHMDSLAKWGRIFANAHCAVPVCSASRASVMSGVAATTHGSYELGPRYEQLPALTNISTIQRYFKDNGYYTLSGGKVLHHGFGGRLCATAGTPILKFFRFQR